MGTVQVEDRGGYIAIAVNGQLNLSLAQSTEEQIRALIGPNRRARLLYDLRDLEITPTLEIVEYAKRFHREIGPLLSRLAVVVASYDVLGRVESVFAEFEQHRTFYDLKSAMSWLSQ